METRDGPAPQDRSGPGRLQRRGFLALLGAGAAGVAVGAGSAALRAPDHAQAGSDAGSATVEFHGAHQAGIQTRAPARAEFAAFDLLPGAGLEQARQLMRLWTSLAAALAAGVAHADDPVPQLAAQPGPLTLTVGFGPRFFDAIGKPEQRPAGVAAFPPFPRDQLDQRYGDADILIQACAEDAVAVSHAIDALAASAVPYASARWRQSGFQHSAAAAEGTTPRNLMGSKDGTGNDPPGSQRFEATVWASGPEYPAWFEGGTTLVLRRIRMDLAAWGAADTRTRERAIGRHLDTGAPLGLQDEFDPVPLDAQTPEGALQIPSSSHVRIAHPDTNAGARMFRRGYNYAEGGESGLLFVALQADATRGFIPVMSRMAAGDDLGRFVTHVGSAVFALPPGVRPGGYWGEGLLG